MLADTLVDQKAFLDRLKASYILAINEVTDNIPAIAALPAIQRVFALRAFHNHFAPTAIRFLSDLSDSTASVVRAETSLPAVKAQTTAKLASDLLTEVYHGAIEYLSKLHGQAADASAAEASHRADFNASRPTSDSVLGNVVGAGVHGYAFGRIFGHATAGGLFGALDGLESSIRQMGTAMNAASQATLAAQRHLELLDECLVGFFGQLDRNAEKLFDWAGSNTFGASLDLSAVHSTAKEANELLRAAVIPILSKLSIASAMTEVQDDQAKLQQEQEKQQQKQLQEQQKQEQARKQEEKEARSGLNGYWLCLIVFAFVVFVIAQLASHANRGRDYVAAPEPASTQAPIAIPEPTPLDVVVSEPASNQAPMATPEPKRSEVERIPMRSPEPASTQVTTAVPEPSPVPRAKPVLRNKPEVQKSLPVPNYAYMIQFDDPRWGHCNTSVMAPDEAAARRRFFLGSNPGCRITQIIQTAGPRR